MQGLKRCQNKHKKIKEVWAININHWESCPPFNHLFQIQSSMRLLAILKSGSLLAMAANCTLTNTTYHLTYKKIILRILRNVLLKLNKI